MSNTQEYLVGLCLFLWLSGMLASYLLFTFFLADEVSKIRIAIGTIVWPLTITLTAVIFIYTEIRDRYLYE